jgi:hypothetical protein
MGNRYALVHGAWLEEIPAPDEPPLKTIADRMVMGDAQRCSAKPAEEITELQPTHKSYFMVIPGIERRRILKSMERFGTEVMPLLSKHFGGLDRVEAAGPKTSIPRRSITACSCNCGPTGEFALS